MRVGIFGGTFDPIHYGHLLLAESCREQVGLDRVWFLPTAIPPHKQQARLTPASTRLEMLRLAIAGHPAFEVCTYEIDRTGINYTVDTLRHLTCEYPQHTFYFLMGADSLRDLPTWREPQQICQLAIPVFVARSLPGREETTLLDLSPLADWVDAPRLETIRQARVQMPRIDLSASEIRQRVHAGRSIRYQLPRAVEIYIQSAGLYLEAATADMPR